MADGNGLVKGLRGRMENEDILERLGYIWLKSGR